METMGRGADSTFLGCLKTLPDHDERSFRKARGFFGLLRNIAVDGSDQ